MPQNGGKQYHEQISRADIDSIELFVRQVILKLFSAENIPLHVYYLAIFREWVASIEFRGHFRMMKIENSL